MKKKSVQIWLTIDEIEDIQYSLANFSSEDYTELSKKLDKAFLKATAL